MGPITGTAKLDIKRFCILIGPQSNGKSTIAKILSTCMWLEKEACTSISETVIEDGNAFKTLVEDFHRMHNYIHPDRSVIEYHSPYIDISYNKGEFSMSFKDWASYSRTKISYIPSDRNVVTMKDIEKRDMSATNFRSFLFDWLDANRHFDSTHKAPILDLDMQYYYNDQLKENNDMLVHENGVTYNIPLYDASSGMQSLVPMTVLMHYLVNDYFDNYGNEMSFEARQKVNDLSWKITQKVIEKYFPEEAASSDYKLIYLKNIKERTDKNDPEAIRIEKEMVDLFRALVIPDKISFIVEEPEQNLFPKTQVSLMNDIVALCNASHPSSVFITTHSPYLLAAANILLFADSLKDKGVSQEDICKCIKCNTSIPINEFSAYSVSNGTCESLLDESTNLIKENDLDSASDFNAEVFDKLYKLYINKLQEK